MSLTASKNHIIDKLFRETEKNVFLYSVVERLKTQQQEVSSNYYLM